MKLILIVALILRETSCIPALLEKLKGENRSDVVVVTPYIVGGEEAIKNEFPFIVYINNQGTFCGGSLIALDLVLTAAHCLYGTKDKDAGKIKVYAGDHTRNLNEGTEQTGVAQAFKWHPQYNEDTLQNDIAVIRLSESFIQTQQVRPILLPPSDFNISLSTSGTVAGWGTIDFSSPYISNVLRKVRVPIRDLTSCQESYKYQASISANQFCAGERDGGKDSCQGDSGGPFICSADNNSICGIVSFGIGCAEAKYPGVYTKVSSYVSWINANRDISTGMSIRPSTAAFQMIAILLILIFTGNCK